MNALLYFLAVTVGRLFPVVSEERLMEIHQQVLKDRRDQRVEDFVEMIMRQKEQRWVVIYLDTMGHAWHGKWPEMRDREFQQAVTKLLQTRLGLWPHYFYWSAPDEYDSWTFHYNYCPERASVHSELLKNKGVPVYES